MERFFAWLQNFRRLVVRYDWKVEHVAGFVQVATIIIYHPHQERILSAVLKCVARAMTESKAEMARTLRQDPKHTVKEICRVSQISEATFYRYTRSRETGVLRD